MQQPRGPSASVPGLVRSSGPANAVCAPALATNAEATAAPARRFRPATSGLRARKPACEPPLAQHLRRLHKAAEGVPKILGGVGFACPALEQVLGLGPREPPPREGPLVMLAGAPVAPACVGLEARVGARQQLSDADRLLDGVADALGGARMLEVGKRRRPAPTPGRWGCERSRASKTRARR